MELNNQAALVTGGASGLGAATARALAAAGALTMPSGLDGVDLLPFLRKRTDAVPHETLFWRRGVVAAVRHGPWKLIRVDGTPTWLFNLDRDFGGTTNLLTDHGELVPGLIDRLSGWERDLIEPGWRVDPYWSGSQIEKHTPPRDRE